ncbi:hypothetical protein J1614_011408 [Plenodomus biglobosus]|nr:hypothetical protein J1614_011408 [Plenodomus biglobosus]
MVWVPNMLAWISVKTPDYTEQKTESKGLLHTRQRSSKTPYLWTFFLFVSQTTHLSRRTNFGSTLGLSPSLRTLRNGEALTDHVIVLELREVTDQEVSQEPRNIMPHGGKNKVTESSPGDTNEWRVDRGVSAKGFLSITGSAQSSRVVTYTIDDRI